MKLTSSAALAVAALSLGGCASGSLSFDPADLHIAVGIGANLYSIGCTLAGKGTSECSKANRRKANAAETAVNGVIDQLPGEPQ